MKRKETRSMEHTKPASGKAISAGEKREGSATRTAESTPVYEIYALKYAGPFTRPLALCLWGKGWDETIEINYYLWAIKGKDGFVLVDAGCGTTWAREQKLGGYVNPVEVLARIGANGSNVRKVLISHMHFDHMGGMEMFPKAFPEAAFYVQKKEFDFTMRSPYAKRALFAHRDEVALKAMADLEGTDRLILVSGDREIMPGMEVLLCPGHTIALQAVAVNTAKGLAIIASDCVHIHRAFLEDLTSIIITDEIAWLKSYDKIKAKATSLDLVFGGHDMDLFTKYPRVAADVTRLV
jgi:glyoxylase-like metal-dependent hydrolase (beta-lactamase superfamily II)